MLGAADDDVRGGDEVQRRATALLGVLLVLLAGCRPEPVEPLVERLDAADVPASWTLAGTEVEDECPPTGGERCPGAVRTWTTDEPEADVLDELTRLFGDAEVESSFDSCGPDTSDCYATLRLDDGLAARVQAVRLDDTTEATALVHHD